MSLKFNPFTGTFDYVTDLPTITPPTPTRIPAATAWVIGADSQVIMHVPIVIEAGASISLGANTYLVGVL